MRRSQPRINRTIFVAAAMLMAAVGVAEEKVDFGREVRPILSAKCYACHGPDEAARKAGLRLDEFSGATAENRQGDRAISPGDAAHSLMLERMLAEDPDERMPPKETGKKLALEEIETLRRWIEEGAEYQEHWSFIKPERPALPEVKNAAWPINGIDSFVLARLEAEGVQPAAEADRPTLIRRVYLDLLGIPPTVAEVEAFSNDPSPTAYETVVDALLKRLEYGEHWARPWLDLARYADSKGYEADRDRIIWRYRDWIIDALNADMPFDQFTREQIAGDLLPNPDLGQLIATAFHRNTMTNDEGGTDNEEFRTAAIVDRVNTTMQTWMGMTIGCAQCHSHKYDPIMNKEFYEFYAFFNQTEDEDLYPDETPLLPSPLPGQQAELDALEASLKNAQQARDEALLGLSEARATWERGVLAQGKNPPELGPWYSMGPLPAETFAKAYTASFLPEDRIDLNDTLDGGAIAWVKRPGWQDGEIQDLEGDIAATYLYRTITSAVAQPLTLSLGSNDGLKVWINGERVLSSDVGRSAAPDQEQIQVQVRAGENSLLLKIVNMGGAYGYYFKLAQFGVPDPVFTALSADAAARTPEQEHEIGLYFASIAPELAEEREQLAKLDEEKAALLARIPTTPIMRELPVDKRRTTRILERGSFLSPGEEVSPGVPAAFHRFKEAWPPDRLGLAEWLVDRDNPLTARVFVNRHWEQFFGTGIVLTTEDFGTQGEWPTNQDLLDWIAVEFMEQGWSMKQLCKLIVTSATYRQDSAVSPELLAADPYNQLYARGPRFRLDAETLRDQALAVSGLLSAKMHGPSVMPPQPEGVWELYGGQVWNPSKGEDKYRRGLYTFWRKTAPYASMVTFDAPSREVCTARRVRTNTPLQAFVTLNDPVYVEAAQALARRMAIEGGDTPESRITHGFRIALARTPETLELERLARLYTTELTHYQKEPEAAAAMATDPIGPAPEAADVAELASLTVLGNVLLNLDEMLVKR